MGIFIITLFSLFVVAFIVFCIMFVHGLIKSKKDYWNFPKHYWIGLFGLQGCAICINILNLIIKFVGGV